MDNSLAIIAAKFDLGKVKIS